MMTLVTGGGGHDEAKFHKNYRRKKKASSAACSFSKIALLLSQFFINFTMAHTLLQLNQFRPF